MRHHELKNSNISEYIIHIYKSEDLLRAYEFNLDELEEYVISKFPISEEEKAEEKAFYADLKFRMEKDNVLEAGHITYARGLAVLLSEMHKDLLESDETYAGIYEQSRPAIEANLKLAEGKVTDEVQICLNGIYGLLILRMRGQKVDGNTLKMLESFGDVLSYLSHKYHENTIRK